MHIRHYSAPVFGSALVEKTQRVERINPDCGGKLHTDPVSRAFLGVDDGCYLRPHHRLRIQSFHRVLGEKLLRRISPPNC